MTFIQQFLPINFTATQLTDKNLTYSNMKLLKEQITRILNSTVWPEPTQWGLSLKVVF